MSRVYVLREIEAARLGMPRGFFPAQTMSYGCSREGAFGGNKNGQGRSVQIYIDGNDVPYRYCGATGNGRPVIEDIGMNTPNGQILTEYLKRRGDFHENPYDLAECTVL